MKNFKFKDFLNFIGAIVITIFGIFLTYLIFELTYTLRQTEGNLKLIGYGLPFLGIVFILIGIFQAIYYFKRIYQKPIKDTSQTIFETNNLVDRIRKTKHDPEDVYRDKTKVVNFSTDNIEDNHSANNHTTNETNYKKYCTECGAKLSSEYKFCPECGKKI